MVNVLKQFPRLKKLQTIHQMWWKRWCCSRRPKIAQKTRKITSNPLKIRRKPPTRLLWRRRRKTILLKKNFERCNGWWNQREIGHMLSLLGLVGWISYWSLGNSVLVVKIMVGIIRKFDRLVFLRRSTTVMSRSDKSSTFCRSRCEWIILFFTLKHSIFPINLFKKKKSKGVSLTPQDHLGLETLFRVFLDSPVVGLASLYFLKPTNVWILKIGVRTQLVRQIHHFSLCMRPFKFHWHATLEVQENELPEGIYTLIIWSPCSCWWSFEKWTSRRYIYLR